MSNSKDILFDKKFIDYLKRDCATVLPGFSDRVVENVRISRQRSKVIRWSTMITAIASCFIAILTLSMPTEDSLNRQTFALIAFDESKQISDLFGIADDLKLLSPIIEETSVVEIFTPTGS